jgi:hypothetical protein
MLTSSSGPISDIGAPTFIWYCSHIQAGRTLGVSRAYVQRQVTGLQETRMVSIRGISRRQVFRGAVAAAGAFALGAPSVHAQNRRALRFVAHADLKVLDPVWTTAYITRNHSYLVYDTLFGTDTFDPNASFKGLGRSTDRVCPQSALMSLG